MPIRSLRTAAPPPVPTTLPSSRSSRQLSPPGSIKNLRVIRKPMDKSSLLELLSQVQRGTVTPESASEHFSTLPFAEAGYEDIGHARIDHHRALRTGLPEVIYAAGKTPEQTSAIFASLLADGVDVLATRVDAATAGALVAAYPGAVHHAVARTVSLRQTMVS